MILLCHCTGGDSKALMFVQISPTENDLSETLSSLNFASRVKRVELGPAKKQVDAGELQKMKQTVSLGVIFLYFRSEILELQPYSIALAITLSLFVICFEDRQAEAGM